MPGWYRHCRIMALGGLPVSVHAPLHGPSIEQSTIIYTTTPSANWIRGEATFLEILNRMNKLEGRLKGKTLQEVESDIYDFRFVNAVLNQN